MRTFAYFLCAAAGRRPDDGCDTAPSDPPAKPSEQRGNASRETGNRGSEGAKERTRNRSRTHPQEWFRKDL